MNRRNASSALSGLALAIFSLMPAGPAPGAQSTPGLSGQWNSNIGAVYEIQQSGNQFTWSAPGLSQSGTGTVSGNDVTLSGPGWTVKGTITETDASGKPAKIVGENGIVLFRTAAGPVVSVAPPAPNAPVGGVASISGQWNSNIGAVYEIQQSGSQFTWSAPGLNQSGSATVSGNSVTLDGPGWTVKGTITQTDLLGKPSQIVGENGVVLFRNMDGQPGSVPPPALPPGPQGSPRPGATGDWSQFEKAPPLSPQVLAQVAAPVTRRAMIEALSASPATKGKLEGVAASAGQTVNGLKDLTLGGKPAVDAPVPPGSPPAQALLDLWKSPVHFSPTVPGPSYLVGGSTRVVGVTYAGGIYVHPANTLQMMAQKDYFLVVTDGFILVHMDLPPGGGQYMVAIHLVSRDGAAVSPSGLAAAEAHVRATTPEFAQDLTLVKNSANTALVGLFSEDPANQGETWAPTDSMPHFSVTLAVIVKEWGWVYFTGVTVTRL